MGKRLALLSNVNMNFVIRMLQGDFEVYQAEGYGNELGLLLNSSSSYHAFGPEVTVVVMDLLELLEHDLTVDNRRIGQWFSMVESSLQEGQRYLISDAYLWGPELGAVQDMGRKRQLEQLWQESLDRLCAAHPNVQVLPYSHMIEELGEENSFSMKMWYMGRILHTNEAQKRLSSLITHRVGLLDRVPRKVLLLDLDNTLWGGLAGENDHTPVTLSEDHAGLAYKNLQRVILQMKNQGTLLAMVSKNNEADALEILEKHPHCVLRPECFAARRINWEPKHENIRQIAQELNLGLDSFVFWDDNPAERELVASLLPEVAVPPFPDKPEELAPAMVSVYREYFEAAVITREDLDKTEQYAANARRHELEESAGDFDSYLKQLAMVVTRVEPEKHLERLTQLANKTNQFNLTTRRYEQAEMQKLLQDPAKKVYLYRVEDCFGDNGIVAAAIADKSGGTAVIEELVMSCRVMGRNIEYALFQDIEEDLRAAGCQGVKGLYLPTAKNKPVEDLYTRLGYQAVHQEPEGAREYYLSLEEQRERHYFARLEIEGGACDRMEVKSKDER